MNVIKRIGALLLVLVLVGLYLSTLYFAITESPHTMRMFAVSIVATIVLPVLLYVYKYMIEVFSRRNTGSDDTDQE